MLLLDIPLRTIQGRRLDSGEGDEEFWDTLKNAWVPNEGMHAKYWKGAGANNPRRGVLRRIDGPGRHGSDIVGLYINSNKTQDREKHFDETSGYDIPWQHDDVVANLSAMRLWQEKFNPVFGPLPRADVPKSVFKDEPSAVVRMAQPDRFYLFREPLNEGSRGREAPPTYAALLQFFHDALSELERRLNEEDPDASVAIITRRDSSGLPKQAIYTMHGMRSSTITALYEQGVPIAMLSKLVAGHTTILMTLRYVKYEPAHVSEVLTSARQRSLAADVVEFTQRVGRSSFEEAAKMTARLADDGLHQAHGQYASVGSWSGMDIGICPNGQTLCQIGGERIRTITRSGQPDQVIYGPVPGGSKNCVRCRLFFTGLPYLIPMWGYCNSLSAKAGAIEARMESNNKELRELKHERHKLVTEGEPIPAELRRRIVSLDAEWDADHGRRDQVLADFHSAAVLVEKIRAIGTGGDEKVPMVFCEDGLPEMTGRESTRFELTDAVVQMGRFFPSMASSEMERERDGFVDRILYNSGYTPFSLTPLTASEKARCTDALAALLLRQVGAAEAEDLIAGRKSLEELGIGQRLNEVARSTIGKPLERLQLSASTIVIAHGEAAQGTLIERPAAFPTVPEESSEGSDYTNAQ